MRAPAAGPLGVLELRDYRVRDGMGSAFMRYFEEHFLFSQRAEGMHVLGQFAVVGAPDRFVWIRGFRDMAARRRGLEGFYGGAFWQARRAETNAMILDSDDVQLLQPLALDPGLTDGLSLEDRAGEPAGVVPSSTGLVAVDFHRSAPGGLRRLVERFERVRSALVEHGHQLLGHFVAEPAPNDYPRLPATQDPDLLVVLSAYRDDDAWAAMRVAVEDASAALAAETVTMRLRPTARSLIRYRRP